MIPAYNPSGVLPPFLGTDPADRPQTSPYTTTMSEIVAHFATSAERVGILKGLIAYRAALRLKGIVTGYQWIDGSFVEDCENLRNRPPKDIDIVTIAQRPSALKDDLAWRSFFWSNLDLFDPERVKELYKCDAYIIELGKSPHLIVSDTAYWYGLFSHQRDTSLWKGMLLVNLTSDDVKAQAIIEESASC